MERVRLGNICKLRQGFQVPLPEQSVEKKSGYVRFIRIVDYTQQTTDIRYVEDNENYYYVEPDDIVMIRYGAAGEVGHGIRGVIANNMFLIEPQIDINKNYLYYYLAQKKIREKLVAASTSTTMPALNFKIVNELEIPLYSKEKQDYLVLIFNLLSDIIEKRKKELLKLENLIKSRFVEMFGDPSTNPKRWDIVNISNVVGNKVSNGFFAKRDDYCEKGNVKVLGVANIVNRMYSNINDLPETNATDKDIKKYSVKYGDMLFCRSSLVAEGIGKASIVSCETPGNVLFECHVIRLPLDLTKCVPEFMQVLSTTDYFRNQVISQSKTATMTTIGQDGILKTNIILPPIELQEAFLSFVKHIDKLKLEVQQSLDKTQLLFDSLMQEYFG